MRVLVIIPAYNEQECLTSTVNELVSQAGHFDFLVVNDGSSDKTEQICIDQHYPHITHATNLGLTAGFQSGAKYALRHGYDAAIQFDADGQHVPEYIQTMLDQMEKCNSDIVVGSRFVTTKKDLSIRMLGSRIITKIIKMTTGQRISDPTSGMRLYNRRALEEFATRYDFGPEPDSLALLMRRGFKVTEAPVKMRERVAGESYLSAGKSIIYMLRTCVSILFVQWFR